ncbi:MAG: NAD(P)-dependent oxidoreductase [Lentisphaerota bacterium]
MQSVLITGTSGFIGSHLAEIFLKHNCNLALFIRKRNELIDEFEQRGAKIIEGSFESKKTLMSAVHGMDVVIHNAGTTKAFQEQEYLKVNSQYTKNLLNVLNGNQKLIFISSQAAAGPSSFSKPLTEEATPNPISYYGKSKLLAEQYIKEWGAQNNSNFIILRPSAIFGPGDKAFFPFFKAASKGFYYTVSHGIEQFSIIYVKDLAFAIIKLVESGVKGKTYFVSSNDYCNQNDLMENIKKTYNRKKLLTARIPIHLISFGVNIFEKFYRNIFTLNSQKLLELKHRSWLISSKQINDDLQWEAEYSLEHAVNETAQWYISHKWL